MKHPVRWLVVVLLTLGLWFMVRSAPLPTRAAGPWYVDAVNGSNTTGTGSEAQPWQTITYAVSHVSGGDTVMIGRGTYNSALGETFPITVPVNVNFTGAGSDVTHLVGQPTVAVLSIAGVTASQIQHLSVAGGDIGVHIIDEYAPARPIIRRVRSSNNRLGMVISSVDTWHPAVADSPQIIECEVISNTEDGLQINVSRLNLGGHTGMRMQVISSTISGNGAHGVHYSDALSIPIGHVLTADQITGNGGHGILLESRSYSSGIILSIDRTEIDDNAGYALAWSGAGSMQVGLTNSVVTRNHQGGLHVPGHSYGGYFWGPVTIVNSTIAHNDRYGIDWYKGINETPISIKNSILWNPDADDLHATDGASWSSDQVQYSIIEDGDLAGESGNLAADPLLRDDYHLSPCSPAIDAASAQFAPAYDYDGDPRPLGSLPDIGADEETGSCPLRFATLTSAQHVEPRETVTFTLHLTNTAESPLSLVLTNTVKPGLIFQPGSLQVTLGTADFYDGYIRWTGNLSPGGTLTMTFAGYSVLGWTQLRNLPVADAGLSGLFPGAQATVTVDPYEIRLPLLHHNFCGDFTDDFSNAAGGWPVGEDAYVQAQYLNSEYQLFSKVGGNLYGFASPACAQELYRVEADARWAGAATSGDGYALLFDITPDLSHYGVFYVSADYGDFALDYRDAAGVHQIVPFTPSAAINRGTAVNRLTVIRRADAVTLVVNGVTLGTWSYAPVSGSTRTGVAAQPYNNRPQADARFDNFVVKRQSAAGSAGQLIMKALSAPTISISPAIRGFAPEVWRERAWSVRLPIARGEH